MLVYHKRIPPLLTRNLPKPDAVFFHSDYFETTYRIYQLTDDQKQTLLHFLLSDDTETPPPCPLPILGDNRNDIRVDPKEDIEETGIYRDIWERKPIDPEGRSDARFRDVFSGLDYPYHDASEAQSRAFARRERNRLRLGIYDPLNDPDLYDPLDDDDQ